MIHQKTTKDGNREIRICERKSIMDSRRICLGRIGKHPTVAYAAEELGRYLKRIDPALSVEIFPTDAVTDTAVPVIWVGKDPSFCTEVPAVENPSLDDAIAIKIENGGGYITGSNERSVLIAVYRFLKELGCDWVRPGVEGERIPQKEISCDHIQIQEKASYRHRGVCMEGAVSYENAAEMIDFLPKIGMNAYFIEHFEPVVFFRRWYNHKSNPYLQPTPISRDDVIAMRRALEKEIAKRGILYHKTGHGWTNEPFGMDGTSWSAVDPESVPEETKKILAQIGGERTLWKNIPMFTNLCYSQPDVRKRMIDAIVAHCKENPNIDMLHFWLADGTNNHCECEACAQMLPADWYVLMLNELDEALTAQKIDTKIVFLIYVDLLWAPEKHKLNNPNRFILMFAPITRNYGQNYGEHLHFDGELPEYQRNKLDFAASLGQNLAQLRQWQKGFAGDSFIYDYHLMYAHFNDPGYEACAKNVFEDMKCLSDMGLNGMVSCQLQRCFFPTALPMKMMAAALWDKNCDYEQMANAYYLSAFGPDGMLVRRYMQTISCQFAIYEGPSHGRGAKIDGQLCQNYRDLEQCVAEFAPIIDKYCGADAPWSADWQILKMHSQYVLTLAKALELTQSGDDAGAQDAIREMLDDINQNELALQKVVDGNKMKMHWGRRLDRSKCCAVDVL